jgi:hypothetical protein
MTQIDVFLEIWNERSHVSEISGEPLIENRGQMLWINQFFHILPKSIYRKAKLSKENIILTTWVEHNIWTTRMDKCRELERWDWVFEKYERLKQEYHQGKFDNP